MSANPNNVSITRKKGLCTGCEACKAVCPVNAISTRLEKGVYQPVIDKEKCIQCGFCLDICPGIETNPDNVKKTIPGKILAGYTGYSKSEKLRKNSTSGGMITTLVLALLQSGQYNEAFVLKHRKVQPASDPEEIVKCAKSKYLPASIYEVIKTLDEDPEKKYVFVGTACQFQAILKFMKHKKITRKNHLFFGLVCDRTLNLNALKYFEDRFGKKNEKLSRILYRTKETGNWLGDLKFVFDSSREVFASRVYRTSIKDYFQLRRCLYCVDKLNRSADITFGDNYLPGEQDPKGKSSMLVRTTKGERVLKATKNLFDLEKVETWKICAAAGIDDRTGRPSDKRLKRVKIGENYSYLRARLVMAKDRILEKITELIDVWSTAIIFSFKTRKTKADLENSGSKNNIVISGGSFLNKGAEAMTYTLAAKLKKKYPDKKIVLLSIPKVYSERKEDYKFNIVDWQPDKTISALKTDRFDGLFNDTAMWFDISGFALSSQLGIWPTIFYLLNIMTAAKYRIPFTAMPQSFGPFDYPLKYAFLAKLLLRNTLNYPVKMTGREKRSSEHLSRYRNGPIETAPDIVLTGEPYNPPTVFANPNEERLDPPAIEEHSVGIVPNIQTFKRVKKKSLMSLYKRLIQTVLYADKKVYILRHSVEDKRICEELKALFSDNQNVKVIAKDYSCIVLEKIIKQFEFVAASRYHSIVHAYKNGVPALILGWADKYLELAELFDQKEYNFDLRKDFEPKEIIKALRKLLRNENRS